MTGFAGWARAPLEDDLEQIQHIDDAIPGDITDDFDLVRPHRARHDLFLKPTTLDTDDAAGAATTFKELDADGMQACSKEYRTALLDHSVESIVVDDQFISDVQLSNHRPSRCTACTTPFPEHR